MATEPPATTQPAHRRATRLAPSPTGSLHLGNLRTFLFAWIVARSEGWSIVLRMEDLDAGRVRAGAAQAIVDALRWLGIDWDGPILTQSDDLSPYLTAMRTLAAQRLVYPCELSRAQVRAALSAPHANAPSATAEGAFPAHLRPTFAASWGFADASRSHRFVVASSTVHFDDMIAGPQSAVPAADVGDFIVWTRDGVPSYQLAVTVDDARQRITDVIRGDDLLPSAARQVILHNALASKPPRWWHLSLVHDSEGRRLAKRNGAHQIEALRADGATPERVVGLLGWWLGLLDTRTAISAAELLGLMCAPADGPGTLSATRSRATRWSCVPSTPVTLRMEDLSWLCAPPTSVTTAPTAAPSRPRP